MEIAFDVSVATRDHVFSGPSICLLIVAKHGGGVSNEVAIAHLIKEIAQPFDLTKRMCEGQKWRGCRDALYCTDHGTYYTAEQ